MVVLNQECKDQTLILIFLLEDHTDDKLSPDCSGWIHNLVGFGSANAHISSSIKVCLCRFPVIQFIVVLRDWGGGGKKKTNRLKF